MIQVVLVAGLLLFIKTLRTYLQSQSGLLQCPQYPDTSATRSEADFRYSAF